jgi:signal transduction histidine kinase
VVDVRYREIGGVAMRDDRMRWLHDGLRIPKGLAIDSPARAELVERWNRFRVVICAATIAAGLVLWPLGFERVWIAMTLAVGVGAHALLTWDRPRANVALVVDVFFTFFTLEVLGVPTPVLAIAYVTFGVIATVICKPLPRLGVGALGSVLFVTAAYFDIPGSEVPDHWAHVAGWFSAAILIVLLLAVLTMTTSLIQQRLEDLETLVESKDDLIATVGHQIRTPLSAVLGFSEMLRADWDSFTAEERRELAALVASQSQGIGHVVDDLLVSARADLGTLAIRLETVGLHNEINGILQSRGESPGRPIDLQGEDADVEVDPARFRQVLRHLISNAVFYGGDRVWIETVIGREMASVRVCDDGSGISEPQRSLVFDPYYRAHEDPTQPASFGLGLSVSRRLAEAMGGSLTFDHDGEKSIFEITVRRPLAGPEELGTDAAHGDVSGIFESSTTI